MTTRPAPSIPRGRASRPVRWTRVTHFHGSGPADRHYVLDADTGELRFGDGLSGRAPPGGRGNVVDSVTNLAAAAGGSAREDDARVRARGPKRLRHRGRAVTAADLEDLAFEAAAEVARAHALTVVFNPIDVGIDLTAPDVGAREQG